MEVIVISWIGSALISIYISNKVGIHYLNELDKNWNMVFEKMKDITLDEIKKHTH